MIDYFFNLILQYKITHTPIFFIYPEFVDLWLFPFDGNSFIYNNIGVKYWSVPSFPLHLQYSALSEKPYVYHTNLFFTSNEKYRNLIWERAFRRFGRSIDKALFLYFTTRLNFNNNNSFFIGATHFDWYFYPSNLHTKCFFRDSSFTVKDPFFIDKLYINDFFSNYLGFDSYNNTCQFYVIDDIWSKFNLMNKVFPEKSFIHRVFRMKDVNQWALKNRFFTRSLFFDYLFDPHISKLGWVVDSIDQKRATLINKGFRLRGIGAAKFRQSNMPHHYKQFTDYLLSYVDLNFDKVCLRYSSFVDFDSFGSSDRFVVSRRSRFPSFYERNYFLRYDVRRQVTRKAYYRFMLDGIHYRHHYFWRIYNNFERQACIAMWRVKYPFYKFYLRVHYNWAFWSYSYRLHPSVYVSYHRNNFQPFFFSDSLGFFYPITSFFHFNFGFYNWNYVVVNNYQSAYLYYVSFSYYFFTFFFFFYLFFFFMYDWNVTIK